MNKELLFSVTKDDLVIETYRGSGAGGQNRNTRDTAVRITHPASGAVGKSEDERSQHQNKRMALKRLATHPKFKLWVAQVSRGLKTDKEIEQEVKESIANPANIKTEVKQGKAWVEKDPEELT
jgi:protein subunit release factor B